MHYLIALFYLKTKTSSITYLSYKTGVRKLFGKGSDSKYLCFLRPYGPCCKQLSSALVEGKQHVSQQRMTIFQENIVYKKCRCEFGLQTFDVGVFLLNVLSTFSTCFSLKRNKNLASHPAVLGQAFLELF